MQDQVPKPKDQFRFHGVPQWPSANDSRSDILRPKEINRNSGNPDTAFHRVPQWPVVSSRSESRASGSSFCANDARSDILRPEEINRNSGNVGASTRELLREDDVRMKPSKRSLTAADMDNLRVSINSCLRHEENDFTGASIRSVASQLQHMSAHLDAQVQSQSQKILERVMQEVLELFGKFEEHINARISNIEDRGGLAIQKENDIILMNLNDAVLKFASLSSEMHERLLDCEASLNNLTLTLRENSLTCILENGRAETSKKGKSMSEVDAELRGYDLLSKEDDKISRQARDLLSRLKNAEDNVNCLKMSVLEGVKLEHRIETDIAYEYERGCIDLTPSPKTGHFLRPTQIML